MMAKTASPSFQRQVRDSQNSSIEAIESHIEELNPKEIPVFLSHLSNGKDPENYNGNCKVSLLDALVRTQGRNIIPFMSTIMSILIQALEFSHEDSSFSLHETCSRLTCAISRYGIDPLVPESEKIKVISCLCGPLLDSLLSSQKNIASVCAFCIRALVESNNWKYASSELVNQICTKVAGALEEEVGRRGTGTHLGLAISLSKQNPLVIEPYARCLIMSGLLILSEGGPHMKVLSAEMIHSIMRCVNPRAISSEIRNIIVDLENLVDDSVLDVRYAVLDALETAKAVEARRNFGLQDSSSPVAGLISRPKSGSGCNCSSYVEFNSTRETMSAKDEPFLELAGKRVNGCGYAGLGSRERYPMEAVEGCQTGDIVGSGSDGWKMARCNRCMVGKSHLHQRIRRHNSMDNLRRSSSPKKDYTPSYQKLPSQFSLSSNAVHRSGSLISSESERHRGGNLPQDMSSETEQGRTGGGNLGETCMPFCEACDRRKRQETMSRGEKRCGFVALNLVLGVFVVIFAIIFRIWLMGEDKEFRLAPT